MAKWRANWSIGFHLLVLVLVVVAPFVGFWVLSLDRHESEARAAAVQDVRSVARLQAAPLTQTVRDANVALARLASHPDVVALNPDSCGIPFAETLDYALTRRGIWSRDLSGRFVCGSPPPTLTTLPLGEVSDGRDGIHVVVVRARELGDRALPLAISERPLIDGDGRTVGAAGLAFALPFSRRFEVWSGHGEDLEALVVAVVDATSIQADRIAADASQPKVIPFIDARPRFYAIEPIEGTTLRVVVGLLEARVTAGFLDTVMDEAWGMAVAVLISLGLAVWFGRWIARPIIAASRAMDTLPQQEPAFLPARARLSGLSEIDHVTAQFEKLLGDFLRERERLVESEERYRTLFESMTSGLALCEVVLDGEERPTDLRIVATNPAFETLVRLPAAELESRCLRNLFPAIDRGWILRQASNAAGSDSLILDDASPGTNGRYLELRAFRTQPDRIALVVRDLTEQKRSSRDLAILAERITLATNAAGIGIWEIDIVTGGGSWDSQMHRLFGRSGDTVSCRAADWLDTIEPEDRERIRREYDASLAAGAEWATEFRVLHDDGSVHTLRASGRIQCDEAERPLRMVGIAWDVTDYCNAIRDLRAAKEVSEAAVSTKTRFLQTMSHELRTPLNAIQGFAQLLVATETRADRREYLDIICRAAVNLLDMIEDMLGLARIDSGRMQICAEPFQLDRELDALRDAFSSAVAAKGLAFSTTIAPNVPRDLIGDTRILRQVLMNLVGNAVKFTHQGGVRVHVACQASLAGSEKEVRLRFDVHDTGIGISPRNQQRVFEVFEQEDESLTRRYGGPGLGLAIAKRLVTRLGGEIGVESQPGVGSRFFFLLDFDVAGMPAERPAAANLDDRSPRRCRILVVEDDPYSRQLVGLILEQKGCDVLFAADGNTAVRALGGGDIDLALMDIQLPHLNGLDVMRSVRAGRIEGCRADLPIIAVTAYARPEDEEYFRAEGMTDYMSKPIDTRRLLALVLRYGGQADAA